jgi:hypothetical protein
MASTTLVDIAGRRRSAATLPGYHRGRPPSNKGFNIRPTRPRSRPEIQKDPEAGLAEARNFLRSGPLLTLATNGKSKPCRDAGRGAGRPPVGPVDVCSEMSSA